MGKGLTLLYNCAIGASQVRIRFKIATKSLTNNRITRSGKRMVIRSGLPANTITAQPRKQRRRKLIICLKVSNGLDLELPPFHVLW